MKSYEVFIVGKRDEDILFCSFSKDEAVNFARRFPDPTDDFVEIREYERLEDLDYNVVPF